jgi:hypothetical protein
MGIILDRLTTVEEFESLANNVQKSNPVLAREARRRGAVEQRGHPILFLSRGKTKNCYFL